MTATPAVAQEVTPSRLAHLPPAEATIAHNLPAALSSFVGRDGDRFRDRIVNYLEHDFGLKDFGKAITVEHRFTPLDFERELNAYLGTMPEERSLVLQLHERLTYLNNQGVVTILILAQQGVVGDVQNPIDLSFLSNAVVLLRFFEAAGEVRKAISVIKKRTGVHDLAIREYQLSPHGLRVGPPLMELQGVFTGVPAYSGPQEQLIASGGDAAG